MRGGGHELAAPRSTQLGLRQYAFLLGGAAFVAPASFAMVGVLAGMGAGAVLFIATLLAAACIFFLRRALAPLGAIAAILEISADGVGEHRAPGAAIDNTRRMRANADAISAKLEKMKRRPRRHALTGLPLQEEFLSIATDDIESGPNAVLLGLVRLANYDAMAAFDPASAEQALSLFAQRLRGALGTDRTLAHIDRDCFAIWFRGVAPHKECAAELQALSYVLAQEIDAPGFNVGPDVQIGSALYPIDAKDAANLLSRAFVSLARPQRTADGGLAFFAHVSAKEARRRFTLEQQLRLAIEAQQLELHYQPCVDLARGVVTGAEALLRWRHPMLGAVSPAEFIPILEETSLIEEIGLWTMNTACRQIRAWRDGGIDVTVALNISARQLRNPLLGKIIERTLAAHKLAPKDLELELTETAAMEDGERTRSLFQQLRSQGFGIAIDDFGSGYSSMGYLKNLPFSKLKIDREFVAHVDSNSGGRAICKALIELANGLGITVLAEGVERREEVETLMRLGCTRFQGFYFAKAMEASAFEATIANPDWQALIRSSVHRQQEDIRRRVRE